MTHNTKFTIESAQASGYVVMGNRTYEMRQDGINPPFLFAGTLDDCLAYIHQEIVKHDDWRNGSGL